MKETLTLESATPILVQAEAARDSGDTKTAIGFYSRVANLSDDKEALVIAVDGLLAYGEDSAALAALENALNQWPGSLMLLVRAANVCEATGNYAGAARYLQKIIDRRPNKARYWLRLGDVHATAGNWQDAEAAYAQTLTIAPLDPTAAMGRGDALIHLGRIEEALTCFRRVLKLLPDHAEAALKLGNLLSSTNNFEEAIGVLRRAVQLNPRSAPAHVVLGSTLHYSGREEEGLALCRRAIDLDPNLSISREATGLLLIDSGRVAEAAEVLSAVDRAHASIAGLIAKFSVAILSEDTEAAERALQRALSMDPQHGEARHLLAAMHREPVSRPAPGFVENIFSRLARRFDQRMTRDLGYEMPQRVASAFAEARDQDSPLTRWLDLGCGTGLVASALASVVETKESIGVDITQEMLGVAASKNLYNQLILGDAEDALREVEGQFELITAIDLFAYLGDLKETLSLVSSRLVPNGFFIYTHEQANEGAIKLRPSGRFAHNTDHLQKIAASAGLKVINNQPTALRYDRGEEVQGFICVLSAQP
jgi:predicted TPR repeat methyltransferase